jgi:hypothetical protein
MTRAELGVRTHSGWAVLVVVAGPANAPVAVNRRRIEIADPRITGSMQPYHAAAKFDLRKAEAFVERCARSAQLLAEQAIRAVIDGMKERGYDILGGGTLLASGRPAPALAATLASHALIHAAEGEHFRSAVVQAFERCALPLTAIRERELWAHCAAALHRPAGELQHYVAEMGRRIGPPWRQDEKLAAMVGWHALAGGSN